MLQYLNLILCWIFFGLVAAYFAPKRNRNPFVWFCIGLLFSLFGVLLLFILPPIEAEKRTNKEKKPLPPLAPMPHSEATMRMWYYLDRARKTNGPVDFSDLSRTFEKKEISEHSYLWTEGMENWKPLKDIPILHKELINN